MFQGVEGGWDSDELKKMETTAASSASCAKRFEWIPGRVAVHRRLGVLAAYVAVLLIPVSALVVVRAIPRLYPIVGRDFVRGLVVGDLMSLVFFSVFNLPFVNHGAGVLIDAVLAAQP